MAMCVDRRDVRPHPAAIPSPPSSRTECVDQPEPAGAHHYRLAQLCKQASGGQAAPPATVTRSASHDASTGCDLWDARHGDVHAREQASCAAQARLEQSLAVGSFHLHRPCVEVWPTLMTVSYPAPERRTGWPCTQRPPRSRPPQSGIVPMLRYWDPCTLSPNGLLSTATYSNHLYEARGDPNIAG